MSRDDAKPGRGESARPLVAKALASDARPPRSEEIAHRAYELWEQAGRPEGREQEHWHLAERDLISRSEGVAGTVPPARRRS
ncbi:MAG: DUF2934 domain-containing protein [Opitutaceae bacterium]